MSVQKCHYNPYCSWCNISVWTNLVDRTTIWQTSAFLNSVNKKVPAPLPPCTDVFLFWPLLCTFASEKQNSNCSPSKSCWVVSLKTGKIHLMGALGENHMLRMSAPNVYTILPTVAIMSQYPKWRATRQTDRPTNIALCKVVPQPWLKRSQLRSLQQPGWCVRPCLSLFLAAPLHFYCTFISVSNE